MVRATPVRLMTCLWAILIVRAKEVGPWLQVHREAPIEHRFVPELQAPQSSAPFEIVNVTRDLGANNPSIQYDGSTYHYHFARGDAGWISAFEVANRHKVRRIYFPRGCYWFGQDSHYVSTFVDMSAFPSLWDGTALEIFGDGDYLTQFTSWAPIVDGSMLELGTTRTMATMSWRIHGMHFDACSPEFALSINHLSRQQPRVEHNNLAVFDVSVSNRLENNTCHGKQFAPAANQTSVNAKGGIFLGHAWSSYLNVGLATVATGSGMESFNETAGVVLDEVQYSTLSLRGTGTHSDASFSGPEPWNPSAYNGWGIIFMANVNSNTVVQTHCEGSGGCVLFAGPGCFENQFTTSVMSMMQRVLVANHDDSNFNVFQGVVVNRYPVLNPTTNVTVRFSDRFEGTPETLKIEHSTVIGN